MPNWIAKAACDVAVSRTIVVDMEE
jgi:hypothetical protein